jgi:hypothetical protein
MILQHLIVDGPGMVFIVERQQQAPHLLLAQRASIARHIELTDEAIEGFYRGQILSLARQDLRHRLTANAGRKRPGTSYDIQDEHQGYGEPFHRDDLL